MNIVMIAQEYPPYLLGGIATHVQALVKGLVNAGHKLHVFTYSMERTFTIEDQGASIHFFQFPLKNRKSQYHGDIPEVEWANHKMAEYVQGVFLNKPSPDIIHAHEWLTFSSADHLRTCFGVPVVITIHGLWSTSLKMGGWYPHIVDVVQQERDSCRRADRVIAVSQWLKSEIMAQFCLESPHIDVVWNGFDQTLFDPALISHDTVNAERERLGIGGNRLIVYAGRLSPQKGVSGLLRSALRVLRQREDVSYAIAGRLQPGSYSDVLVNMVEHQAGLKNKVHFLDWVSRERLAVLYKLAALVVVPSIAEAFGYAAVEPMAAGKPVIAGNAGGLAEIVENEQSGLLVPLTAPGSNGSHDVNVQKLAEAQMKLLDDPLLARRFGESARARVRLMFSLEQMIAGTLRTYQSLAPI